MNLLKQSHLLSLLVILILSSGTIPMGALQDEVSLQTFTGTVEAFEGAVLIVDDTVFDVTAAVIGDGVAIGETVMVQAIPTNSAIWIASAVDLFDNSAVTIRLEGPIETMDGSGIVVGGLEVFIAPDDPVLAMLAIDVEVIIEGEANTEDGRTVIIARSVTLFDEDTDENIITVIIEGPVQAININIITIFGFDIELPEDDPLLTVIQIGDVIQIEGVLTGDLSADGHLTIIAINIILINVDIVVEDDDSGLPAPTTGFSKDDCKKGGWQSLTRANGSGFRNQGDCVSYVNTGR